MAMKYCEQHNIWYDYKEGCPECGKFGRIAGSIIGNIIGGGIWATVTAARKVKEYNRQQKEKEATRISATINKVWDEHNVVFNGSSGINIHVKFEVNNMMNLTGNCCAYLNVVPISAIRLRLSQISLFRPILTTKHTEVIYSPEILFLDLRGQISILAQESSLD